MSGSAKPISEWTFLELIKSFWIQEGNNGPINEVLWFIRDLMVMVVVSPVFYHVLHKLKFYPIIVLLLWYVCDASSPLPGLRPVAFFFFGLGSYLGLNNIDMINAFTKYGTISTITYCILLPIAALTENLIIENISVIVGVPACVYCIDKLVEKLQVCVPTDWITATFFLYVYHDYAVIALKKGLFKMIMPEGSIGCLFIYITTVLVACVFFIALYFALKRLFPKTMGLVVGGR